MRGLKSYLGLVYTIHFRNFQISSLKIQKILSIVVFILMLEMTGIFVDVSAEPALLYLGSSNVSGSYGPGDCLEINATYDEALLTGSSISVLLNNSVSLTLDNLSTKINPRHEGSISNGDGEAVLWYPYSVYVKDNYAYIAVSLSEALEIVNISDPGNPCHEGSYVDATNLSQARDVFVSGNYAYIISASDWKLLIVDISDPKNPGYVGQIVHGDDGAILRTPTSVYVSGNYAYVTSASNSYSGLEIVNVSNPSNPSHEVKLIDDENGSMLSFPESVFISGDYAYVASSSSNALQIIDIHDPKAPLPVANVTTGFASNIKSPISVFVSGGYAYVVCEDSLSLEIIDVTNTLNPVPVSSISYSDLAKASVFVSGNYAYLTRANDDILEIIDVSNPSSPIPAGNISNVNLDDVHSVFVSGGMAYLTGSVSNTLEIVSTGSSTLSGVYSVKTGEATPLLNVDSIISQNAVSMDGMRTNSLTSLPPINLADNVRFKIIDPLKASFTYTPDSGIAPLNVSFNDTSTGSPTCWNWSFGNGDWFNTTDPALKNKNYAYTSAGTYSVCLIVSNAYDSNISSSQTITVSTPTITLTPTVTQTTIPTVSPTITLTSTSTATPTPSSSPRTSSSSGVSLNNNIGTGSTTRLNAGSNVSFSMDIGAVYKVLVTAGREDVDKVMITVKKGSSLPSSIDTPDTEVYEYENATLYYADDSDLAGGTLFFKVKKSWLIANGYSYDDIVMLHYNEETGEWEELETTFVREEGGYYYYTADTPSFSWFAIAVEEGATIVPEETLPETAAGTTAATNTPSSSAAAPGSASAAAVPGDSGKTSSWSSLALSLLLVVLVAVIIAGLIVRKKKDDYPDWWKR